MDNISQFFIEIMLEVKYNFAHFPVANLEGLQGVAGPNYFNFMVKNKSHKT